MLLVTFSASGCKSSVPRPDSDLCVTNVELMHDKCYNLARDYEDDGSLKPGATPTFYPFYTLSDFNKRISLGPRPESWPNLKAYIRSLRDQYNTGETN